MDLKQKRTKRIRGKITAVTSRNLRLSVHRSNKHIYAQIIDQDNASVVASASSLKLSGKKSDQATQVGEELAKAVKASKIGPVYFDRSNYRYHGRIKILAEATRKNGLNF